MKEQKKTPLFQGFLVYWKELKREIKSIIFPPAPKDMTVAEAFKEAKHLGKNQLIQILTNLIAERERAIPVLGNKAEIKQWSKKELITAVLNELIKRKERVDPKQYKKDMEEIEKMKAAVSVD